MCKTKTRFSQLVSAVCPYLRWSFAFHHPELDLLIVSLALIILFVLVGLFLTTIMSNRRSVKLVLVAYYI